ncbi:MAG: arylsulfatase [Planctomycetota bacterium]|nr:arylsulfatase [Planctomycetota bacterium]
MMFTLFCLIVCGAVQDTVVVDSDSPNIVYVLADDLGWGEVGCYGQEKIRTPNIDRLSREGMLFTQHYSGSTVCAPSRCVLLTGKHTGHAVVRNNWENGGWGEDEPEGQYPLPEEEVTIAEVLKGQGYATACIGKWGLGGPNTVGHPNNQGFDHFYGYLCQRKAHNYYPAHLWRNSEKHVLNDGEYYRAHQKIEAPLPTEEAYRTAYDREDYAPDLMRDEAIKFIRDHSDEPFFLYYASPIPHVAIQAPLEDIDAYPREWDEVHYLGQKGYLPHPRPRAAYAAMITRLDAEIGAILDTLEAEGVADDTIVIVSSDNGTTYAGGVDYDFFDSTGPLRGLKGSLYEGGIRVPMVVRWPGHVAAGTTTDHVSGFHDVMPTLADISGADGDPSDGISFLPVLTGGTQAEHEALYWEHGQKQAMRMGQWKAVRTGLKKGNTAIQLYDLQSDPSEKTNVASEHPEIVKRMTRLMDRYHEPSEIFPLPTIDDASGKQES